MKSKPPRLAVQMLRWFVNAQFVEEVEGDLEELFHERVQYGNLWRAKFLYFTDVFRTLRPYRSTRKKSAVGHEIFHGIFFRLAVRNLLKRSAYSTVNIVGLSLGLVSFFLILEYVAFEKSYDSFHENADNIYRVAFDWGETDYNGENSSRYASSVPGMGPSLKSDIAEVKLFTRFVPVLIVKSYCTITRRHRDKIVFSENEDHGFYADENFLKIFSFPMLARSGSPLSMPDEIVITRSFAGKIFGDMPFDQMVGAMLEIDAQGKKNFVVKAVLEDLPDNSHIQFDYLLSYSTINSDNLEGNLGWSQFYTYIQSYHVLSAEAMQPKLNLLTEKLYGKESPISIFLQPLKEIYLTSALRDEVGETGSSQQLMLLTAIAYAILVMAWINYVNMFLAGAMERVNEIGVKKVLGSTRSHLVLQFFTESFLINTISILCSILLMLLLQRPFEGWIGKELSSIVFAELPFVAGVLCIVFLGSLVAGLYPAIILSGHRPVQILGSKFQTSSHGIFFKKGLVYFQFIVSFVIVSGTLIVDRQIRYMQSAVLGFEPRHRVAIRIPAGMDTTHHYRLATYKQKLLRYPFIDGVSSSSSIPGKEIATSGGVQRVIGPELDGNNVFFIRVDEDFLDTYAIKLIAGKGFSESVSPIPSVILNEAALQTLKFDSPEEALNHRIHWQRKEYEVVGVFANYNHLFLKRAFEPIMLSYNPFTSGFITLNIREGYHDEALSIARHEFQSLFPEAPFDYSALEISYAAQYRSIEQFEALSKYFAWLAITISCLGLFALSYYSVQRRLKEVAVRKIFGAGMNDIWVLLSRQYFIIVLLSGLTGSVATYALMNTWLENFAFSIRLNVFDFIVPLFIITILVVLTVSFNTLRTSTINPVHPLKNS